MRILDPQLYLGTSSWSSKDWEGVFYPPGTAPGDYLAHYATRYRTVEVDATFYRIPSLTMTKRWRSVLRTLLARNVPVFGYFNNHYAGHAPGSIDLFERSWESEPLTSPEAE